MTPITAIVISMTFASEIMKVNAPERM